jgi:hypothetical protein
VFQEVSCPVHAQTIDAPAMTHIPCRHPAV